MIPGSFQPQPNLVQFKQAILQLSRLWQNCYKHPRFGKAEHEQDCKFCFIHLNCTTLCTLRESCTSLLSCTPRSIGDGLFPLDTLWALWKTLRGNQRKKLYLTTSLTQPLTPWVSKLAAFQMCWRIWKFIQSKEFGAEVLDWGFHTPHASLHLLHWIKSRAECLWKSPPISTVWPVGLYYNY